MKKIKEKLELMNIMNEMIHHIATCKINGKSGRLLVDTGASKTVFDKDRFKRFKHKGKICLSPSPTAGAGGPLSNIQITILKNMNVLKKVNIKNYLVALTDLSHLNNLFTSLKAKPIDGVLGNDFLVSHGATIEFSNNSITLEYDEKKISKNNLDAYNKIKKFVNL